MTDTFAAAFGPDRRPPRLRHAGRPQQQRRPRQPRLLPGREPRQADHPRRRGDDLPRPPQQPGQGAAERLPRRSDPAPTTPLNVHVPDCALAQVRGREPRRRPRSPRRTGEGNLEPDQPPGDLPDRARPPAAVAPGATTPPRPTTRRSTRSRSRPGRPRSRSTPRRRRTPSSPTRSPSTRAALDTGAHIAAVGSSDDHRAAPPPVPFDAPVGSATTVVYADELSEQAITEAVKGDRTYVKFFGTDGPDVEPDGARAGRSARRSSATTLADPDAELDARRSQRRRAPGRPGSWSLVLLKDGDAGRDRAVSAATPQPHVHRERRRAATRSRCCATSSASTSPRSTRRRSGSRAGAPTTASGSPRSSRNKRKGTAKLTVEVPGPGVLSASGGKKPRGQKRKPKQAGKVKLTIRPKARGIARKLERKGEAIVKPQASASLPDGGEPGPRRSGSS